MRTLNLGILAHVDAGKTSLTERLLHAAGVIDEIGSVDGGNTQTDTLALERQRGITIKSAVVSFVVDDVIINLIDTPGHPDFIAEVERVLSVLDGAVLVVSAVEGVQAQTRVLMRALQRLRIPTLIFVNKIDRGGADPDRVLNTIRAKLTPAVVGMSTSRDAGVKSAATTARDDDGFHRDLAELVADHDEALLAAYVENEDALSSDRLRTALAEQTGRAEVHPVYFGSAITGAGVPELTTGITALLPAAKGDLDGPLSATVFKVDRGPAGEKVAYARVFTGTIAARDRLELRGEEQKVTAVAVFEAGTTIRRDVVTAGRIAQLHGLHTVRIGDVLGAPPPDRALSAHHFAPPTLETVVLPRTDADRGRLRVALDQLAEQDPLIDLRQDDLRGELYVSLYGEVQKEVIGSTLETEYGLGVGFRESTTICVERIVGSGEAVDRNSSGRTDEQPFLATLGLRVDPAPLGSGIAFRLEVELGSMPYAFFRAVEETVPRVLQQGLRGWQVPDAVVTMTANGYWPRQSAMHATFDRNISTIASDFRFLTPLVLMEALQRAGTQVLEPIHRFRLEIPDDLLGSVAPAVGRLGGVLETSTAQGTAYLLEGLVPAARVHELQQALPGLTRGEGVLDLEFDSYQPVRGPAPARPRTDHNPLDRKEYFLHIVRRV